MRSAARCWSAAATAATSCRNSSTARTASAGCEPEGAFYGFLHIDGLKDSLAFAQDAGAAGARRRGARLGVRSAGDATRDSYIRICFAQDPALLAEGLSRLEKALASM